MKASLTSLLKQLANQPGNRKLAGVAALVLLGGWLVWLQDFSQPAPRAQLPQLHGEPEYYLEVAQLKRYNSEGRHFQTLQGQVVTHYPESQLTTVDRPRLQHWAEDGQLWVLSAREGEMLDQGDLYLHQQVRLTPINPDSLYTPEFLTERLWLDTIQETARTLDPVSFTSPGGTTLGLGLFAQLDLGQVEILEQVRSEYLTEIPTSNTREEP